MRETNIDKVFLFIMENEIWKTIQGYEDYQVSNFGRVKSLNYNGTKKERLLSQCKSRGYYVVCLYSNKKRRMFLAHQLVAIAFLNHKPCGFKLVVNHKDFNPLNNHVDNLEVVTNRENCNHKHIKSTSQYTGVSWNIHHKKWMSSIWHDGKKRCLGYFTNEIDASNAYELKLKSIL